MVEEKSLAVPRAPRGVLRVSRVQSRLLKLGVPMGPMRLLVGRRTLPVVVIRRFAGHDWLVAVFGDVAWARAARASGTVRLRHGRRSWTFRAVEVGGEQGAAVARELRRRFWMVPFVRTAYRTDIARPVFRLDQP